MFLFWRYLIEGTWLRVPDWARCSVLPDKMQRPAPASLEFMDTVVTCPTTCNVHTIISVLLIHDTVVLCAQQHETSIQSPASLELMTLLCFSWQAMSVRTVPWNSVNLPDTMQRPSAPLEFMDIAKHIVQLLFYWKEKTKEEEKEEEEETTTSSCKIIETDRK